MVRRFYAAMLLALLLLGLSACGEADTPADVTPPPPDTSSSQDGVPPEQVTPETSGTPEQAENTTGTENNTQEPDGSGQLPESSKPIQSEEIPVSGTESPPAQPQEPAQPESPIVETQPETQENGILIAYFTWAENTVVDDSSAVDVDATTSASVLAPGHVAKMAAWIQAKTGGDLFSIITVDPYSSDYDECLDRAADEKADNARPALSGSVGNMDEYDVVFLGYPIWNNDAPRIIYTFLESENLSGKTSVPFCTSGGSSIANSVSNIRGLATDATWMDGRRCSGSDTTSTLSNWANGLGLDFTPAAAPAPTLAPTDETKVLVAYFSATNTTKPLAEYVADSLGADIYEIVPQTPYTSADLNYGNSSSRTTVEMNDPNARPAISGSVENMGQYDIVFIGYPIWWGQAPRIVSTFLESYDFSGKIIVPFCTSNSSGMGSSAQNLHSLTNDANWLDGRRFSGGTSRNTMVDWVNSLGLDVTAL